MGSFKTPRNCSPIFSFIWVRSGQPTWAPKPTPTKDILAAKQIEAQSILTQSGIYEQEIKKTIKEVCGTNPLKEIGREGEGWGPLKQFPKGLRIKTLAVNIAAYMLTLFIVDNKPNISKNKDFLLYERHKV